METESRETARSWVAMAASAILQAVATAPPSAMSLFLVEWMQHFNASRGVLSLVISATLGILLASGPLSNALAMKYGFRTVTMAGCMVSTVGLLVSAFADNIYWLVGSYTITAGIGFSLMYVPSVTVLPFVFDKNIVVAAAASTVPVAVTLLFFPYLLMHSLHTYGWRHSLVFNACLTAQATVAAALLPNLTSQSQKLPSSETVENEQAKTSQWKCPVVFQSLNICLYLTSGLGIAGNSIIFALAADYVLACGFTIEYASLALLLFGVGSLVVRFIIAALGRPLRDQSLYMQTASIALRAVASFGLPFAKTFAPIGIAMVLFGVGWGIHTTLFTTVANEIVSKDHVATIIGLISLANGAVMFVTPLIASWLLAVSSSYNTVWLMSGCCGVLGVLLAVPVILKKRQQNITVVLLNMQTRDND